jgi:hypothetical protein
MKMSVHQAMRELEYVLNENQDRGMPNKELFRSLLNALREIDERLIALEPESARTTANVT